MWFIKKLKKYRQQKQCEKDKKIFNAGYDARKNNILVNPYLKGSVSHSMWNLGWKVADIFIDDNDLKVI
jgi:hypothetical protein